MRLDSLKTLGADDMFDTAGVIDGRFFVYAQLHKPFRERRVPLVDGLCDQAAGFRQGDVARFIHQNMPAVTEIFHGDTDAGLGKSQLIGDVDGAHIGFLVPQH